MRYLKSFNEDTNIITQDDENHIMDIFQDIIDEYDLEKSKFLLSTTGLFIVDNSGYKLRIGINVTKLLNDKKFKSDIENFKRRLDLDGFYFKIDYRSKYLFYINIYKFEQYQTTLFNENQSLLNFEQEEIDDILDMFQDIVDEFNLTKLKRQRFFSLLEIGEYSYILEYDMGGAQYLKIYANCINTDPRIEFQNFNKRLNSIGYNVSMKESNDFSDNIIATYGFDGIAIGGVLFTLIITKKGISSTDDFLMLESTPNARNTCKPTIDEIDNIKDIFRDLVDEYDLVIPNLFINNNGEYKFVSWAPSNPIEVWINIELLRKNKNFLKDIGDFQKRLESEGYVIKISIKSPNWDVEITGASKSHLMCIKISKSI